MCVSYRTRIIERRVAKSVITKVYFVKHGVHDVLLRKKGIYSPSGPESKQDLLAHVDICRR